jgi:hypothetical protein
MLRQALRRFEFRGPVSRFLHAPPYSDESKSFLTATRRIPSHAFPGGACHGAPHKDNHAPERYSNASQWK